MSKIPIKINKEIPLKIFHETFKTDKNLINIGKLKLKKESEIGKQSNFVIQNNVKESKSTKKINNSRLLTEKNIKRLKLKELYRFNSSSELTNFNTQNNSIKDISQDNSKQILHLIISNDDSSHSKQKLNSQRRLKKLKLIKCLIRI